MGVGPIRIYWCANMIMICAYAYIIRVAVHWYFSNKLYDRFLARCNLDLQKGCNSIRI